MQDSLKSLAKIRDLSNDLRVNYGKDNKVYAQTYAKVGEQAWTNEFVFKAVLNQMKNCGSNLVYEVSGEKISNYQIQNVTAQDAELCKQ